MSGADRKGQLIEELAVLYDARPKDLRKWLEARDGKKERPGRSGRPSVLNDYGVPEERWEEILDLMLANRFFAPCDATGQPISEKDSPKFRRIAEHMVDRFTEEGIIHERGRIAELKTELQRAIQYRWRNKRDRDHAAARDAAADNPPPDLDGDWEG